MGLARSKSRVDPFGGRTHQAILYRIPIAARPIPAINETILIIGGIGRVLVCFTNTLPAFFCSGVKLKPPHENPKILRRIRRVPAVVANFTKFPDFKYV